MKVLIIGGGPGGLYLASLLRERTRSIEVTLYERNRAQDTFGFGVVFSEPTLRNVREQDPGGFEELFGEAVRWPGIDIRIRGQVWRCEGNGFAAIERRRLLGLLTERARWAGVKLCDQTQLRPGAPELADADVVVIADGVNSAWRTAHAARLGASVQTSATKFIWLAVTTVFDGMTFAFEENEHGWFAAHAYPYNDERSTFVVETDEATWRTAGLDAAQLTGQPGESDQASADYLRRVFAHHLDGGRMVVNNSRWASFDTVRTARWRLDERTVLMGDAAHTAHFSVGSGTKMAMEDALALAGRLAEAEFGATDVDDALGAYETQRRAEVSSVQDAAGPSLSWWEHFGEYAQLPPAQFACHFLTRSGRVGVERLRRSDPDFLARSLRTQFGDETTRVLDRRLTVPGAEASARLAALHPADQPCPPVGTGVLATQDLAAKVAPGRTGRVTGAGGVPMAWWCAPHRPADVEAFVDAHRGELAEAGVVFVDAAPEGRSQQGDGEARLAQQRVCEVVRLRHGRVVAMVRRRPAADEAASLVLAGRADVVAVDASQVAALLAEESSIAA
jgi:salicyloyl-CoA 5-hydroxylase